MKIRIKRPFVFFVTVCLAYPINAETFLSNGVNYSVTGPGTVVVASSADASGNLVVPSTVIYGATDYSVTGISDSAFMASSGLTDVTIQAPISSIGNDAFAYCFHLATLSFPSTVVSIGAGAFGGCVSLKKVFIPASVASIGCGAFRGCSDSINVDGNNACYSSYNGILYNKQQTVLMQCPTARRGQFNVPASVTTIDGDAFWRCNLTTITLPETVSSIGYGAFAFCEKLNSMALSPVTTIRVNTFLGCSALVNMTIPSSVAKMEDGAFWNCTSLKNIHSYAVKPPVLSDTTSFYNVNKGSAFIYVPSDSKEAYMAAVGWKNFANITAEFTSVGRTLSGIKMYYDRFSKSVCIDGCHNGCHVTIYDMNGKICLTETIQEHVPLSFKGFLHGVYLMKIDSQTGIVSEKISL
ncbi:MAG: leucine-rich repeat domain-containing protein [Bacteroidota bacterium]|nr:leucine-rich repeat domain-containing protein [Bacteroidota bacterium]